MFFLLPIPLNFPGSHQFPSSLRAILYVQSLLTHSVSFLQPFHSPQEDASIRGAGADHTPQAKSSGDGRHLPSRTRLPKQPGKAACWAPGTCGCKGDPAQPRSSPARGGSREKRKTPSGPPGASTDGALPWSGLPVAWTSASRLGTVRRRQGAGRAPREGELESRRAWLEPGWLALSVAAACGALRNFSDPGRDSPKSGPWRALPSPHSPPSSTTGWWV